jgi:uncharacterized cupredoxin-like copper-binding protein
MNLSGLAGFSALLGAVGGLVGCGSDAGGGSCTPDADGVVGGNYRFEVTVDDTAFTPKILTVQNRSTVRLSLENTGITPHDFAIDCLPTPNEDGCPTKSCFSAAAKSAAIAPGESAVLTFPVPQVEGLYTFRSTQPGDAQTGQFIVQ